MQRPVAVLGTGTIGCSWIALFAASGWPVKVYDPRADAAETVWSFWSRVRGALKELGRPEADSFPTIQFCETATDAVKDAAFVQECIPERLDLKQRLFREIEPNLASDAVVATSSSGLLLTDLQADWEDPSRIIIAHPFNPPHIVPLVELYANARTRPDILPRARRFYEGCGKVTILLRKEVPAHVANRLQAALWREAIHLVSEGVASVKDVDLAVTAGPGLRWAIMGPHMLLNLGGGAAGLTAYCTQFRDSYHEWWDDLGRPKLTEDTVTKLLDGLREEIGDRDYDALRAERDAKLIAALRAISSAKNPA